MADGTPDPSARMRTPLLALISAEALERDYQMVAQRRVASGDQPRGRARASGRVGVIAVVAGFGVLLTIAAVQTSENADVDTASRESLIERIEGRRIAVRALQSQLSDYREGNARAEAALLDLGDAVNNVEGEAFDLGARTGFTPVTGQGIRIELDNAAFSDPDTEHIRDSDLALLVNALWTAGAEAIAINGQRISPRTAIRNSGTAIEVNSTGIAPPYSVQASATPTPSRPDCSRPQRRGLRGAAGDYGWAMTWTMWTSMRLAGCAGSAAAATVGLADEEQRQTAGRRRVDVIAVLGLLVGVLLGFVVQPDVPLGLEPYLPIAVVAALDAVFGALRAYLDGIFDDKVFVVSFISNVVIASGIVYLGDRLGVGGQLSTGVIVVLGIRIFTNVAAIRRHVFHA